MSLFLGLVLNHYIIKPIVTRYLFITPSLKSLIYFTILMIQILFFYNLIYLIIHRNINTTYLNILTLLYTLLLITLLFGRPENTRVINLNPFSSKLTNIITLCNIVLFIPLGILFNKLSITKTILTSILIITLVESLQFIFRVGIFDICDIIFNVLGITVGAIATKKLLSLIKNT